MYIGTLNKDCILVGAHGYPLSFVFAFWKIQSAFLAQSFKIKHAAMGNHIFVMGMRNWFCLIQQGFLSEFQPQGNFFLSNAVIKVA